MVRCVEGEGNVNDRSLIVKLEHVYVTTARPTPPRRRRPRSRWKRLNGGGLGCVPVEKSSFGQFTVNADGLADTFLVGPSAPGAPAELWRS